MNWICIGMLAGSLVTSLHDSKERCEGRAVTLREAKATAKCVEMPVNSFTSITGGQICSITGNGTAACR